MRVIVASILYLVFFTSVQIAATRFKFNKEASRKIIHIIAGIIAAGLPFVMSFKEVCYLSILFIPVMLISKYRNIFSAIHGVNRNTHGEVYFPLSIFITALLFPIKLYYSYGLLIMGVCDGLASLAGKKYGRKKYSERSGKTSVGSMVFFISALVISLVFFSLVVDKLIWVIVASIIAAAILTLAEAIFTSGLDNLILSPLASAILLLATHIFK